MLLNRETKTIEFLGSKITQPYMLLDFLGFEKHVVQIRDKRGAQIWPGWYDHASYYICDLPPEKVFATGDEITIPACVKAPDYEFEIACFVNKTALIKDEKEALQFFKEHCQLTIMNDWSARDIQKKDIEGLGPNNSKSIIGKSFGPKLVPASNFEMDENGVLNAEMILRINGEERSRSNANTLYHTHPTSGKRQAWSFPRIIAWLGQQNITVHAGYVIGSGTVGNGCIAEFSAKLDPKNGDVVQPAKYPWLQQGDTVSMEVQGIGILENKVKLEAASLANAR
ncbi:MAG: fumarylacetoacetate hydrolase family protein [Candidatus Obscuribacterales bacterium]|nr:fumarylacetoacetate hydrolase family protein [Candidatus Obscuribacterales bacterium]